MPKGIYKRKPLTEQHKINIGLGCKGNSACAWNKGTKGLIKAWNKGLIGWCAGEKHPNWKGGQSITYPIDWTKTLRRSIRERDKYTCKVCGKQQTDRAFCIHHIDYNKENCNPDNLITLCLSCHIKTNYQRDKWKTYFYNLIK